MNKEIKKRISDSIADKIKKGEIKMKPKLYFALKTVFVVLGVLIVVLFALYLVSFIVFTLQTNGLVFLPKFGFIGIRMFLGSLPWLLILGAIVLIILLEFLTRRFKFIYSQPVLYSLLILILIVALGSIAIGKTGIHSKLFRRAQEKRLNVVDDFYREYGMPRIHDFYPGMIIEEKDNGFIVEDKDGQLLNILFSPDTKFLDGDKFNKGDRVIILGNKHDGDISAFGVRRIKDGFNLFPPKPFMK